MTESPFVEDIAAKFTAAWEVFARTCSAAVAPEATFQAWFAHYLISQFGIDRVARWLQMKMRQGPGRMARTGSSVGHFPVQAAEGFL